MAKPSGYTPGAMSLIVQKYGGTSVADADRIKRVAARVAATRKAGNDVIVVVSAMGGTTDQLIELARQVSPSPPGREMDMLLTAGERIAMALLAIAIQEEGVEAVSFTGSQAGILTDSSHGQAKIQEIRSFRVEESLKEGKVVIVAGFPGRRSAVKGDYDPRPGRFRRDGGRPGSCQSRRCV